MYNQENIDPKELNKKNMSFGKSKRHICCIYLIPVYLEENDFSETKSNQIQNVNMYAYASFPAPCRAQREILK